MTIKIHLLCSLLIHSIVLTYLLGIPVYRSDINEDMFKKYKEYFVYLKSDGSQDIRKQSLKRKIKLEEKGKVKKIEKEEAEVKIKEEEKIKAKEKGREKVKAEKQRKEEGEVKAKEEVKKDLSSQEQIVEIIKDGKFEHKVIKEKSKDIQVEDKLLEDKLSGDVIEDNKSEIENVQEAKYDNVEQTREVVEVYEGTILKTMPGITMIPHEETSGVEILHARKRETNEAKEGHEIEILEKQKDSHKGEIVVKGEKKKVKAEANVKEELEEERKVEVEVEVKKEETLKGTLNVIDTDKEDNELIEDFVEVGETFDKLRVAEKLAYLRSTVIEKKEELKEREKENTESEEKLEELTKQLEQPVETIKSVVATVESKSEQPSLPPKQMGEEKSSYLEDVVEDAVVSKEQFEKRDILIDIPEIDNGLILKAYSGELEVPYELKISLKPKKGIGKEVRLKSEEKHTENEQTGLSEEIEGKNEVSNVEVLKSKDGVTFDKSLNKDLQKLGNEDNKNVIVENEESKAVVAEILTSEKNRTPSGKEYLQNFEKERESEKTEKRPNTNIKGEVRIGEKKNRFLNMPLPDVLFTNDVKIEVLFDSIETPGVSFYLRQKTHPMNKEDLSVKQKEINLNEEKYIIGELRSKRIFSLTKANRGMYIFEIQNNSERTYNAEIKFYLLEGKPGQRNKEYKTIELLPNTKLKYKFIIPEAIFWDDEDYFTGTIESSDILTKFNDKTGLVWKEKKEY